MTPSLTLGPDYTDLRCSVLTAEAAESPAGTAGTAERYLLLELPLPWTKKIDAHELLAGLDPAPADAGKTQILGISDGSPAMTNHRVICYHRQPAVPFSKFLRSETTVARTDLLAVVTAVRSGDLSALSAATDDDSVIDLLVCTHGTRDRCCGRFGTLLHAEMKGHLSDRVRLWRTSHTGGHRFAPTAVVFPDGTTWAGLTAERLIGIVARTIAPADVASSWRGTGGITTQAGQIADGIGFATVGWSWLDRPRSVSIGSSNSAVGQTATVEIVATPNRFNVELLDEGTTPVPACGLPLADAVKSTPRLRVVRVTAEPAT